MISANVCKINSLALICEYCEKHIEPLLLKSTGPVYYGRYNKAGTKDYYVSKTYAADPPRLEETCHSLEIFPKDIKKFLEMLGYTVEWVQVLEGYPAGVSSSGRTRYYGPGQLSYWSLKISY